MSIKQTLVGYAQLSLEDNVSISSTAPIYLFDIDGTLANCSERQKVFDDASLSKKEQWARFMSRCDQDTPIHPTINTLKLLVSAGAEILFFTGRFEKHRATTIAWLAEHLDMPAEKIATRLTMRPDNDSTEDCVLKETWWKNMLDIDRQRIVAVFDDRQQVVDMWRRNGVTCYQVAEGNF